NEPEAVMAHAWSPDGKRIGFTTPVDSTPDPLYVGMDDPILPNWNERPTVLRSIDFKERGVETLVGGPQFVGPFAWSPDGRRVVFARRAWPGLDGGAMPATIETSEGQTLARLRGGPDAIRWTNAGIFYSGTVRMEPKSSQCLYKVDRATPLAGGD